MKRRWIKFDKSRAVERRKKRVKSTLVGVGAFGGAGSAQHREDVAQTKVIMRLLGQLLLTQAIQHMELLGQDLVLLIAACCQLDLQPGSSSEFCITGSCL